MRVEDWKYTIQPCGAVGIVLRDSMATFLGAIASNIGHASAIEAEFSAWMLAIEKARDMLLTHICLETDSIRVVKAFNNNIGVPWKMRSRWRNCLIFCKSINCSCMHILREGNLVADALAKNGQWLSLYSTQWWPSPPNFLLSFLDRDRSGLSSSRLA
jgi:ribonuclease HI